MANEEHKMKNTLMQSGARIAAIALALAVLSGCATTHADPRDPLEPFNRAMFEFNDTLDKAVLKPVAQGYKAVMPSPVRTGVTNFFSNLGDPWIALNQLLQGKVEEGMTDFMRFVVNTTFGLCGIFDVASEGGMEKHDEDFGQTLGVWGLEPGPYLVVPFLGPSSVRDGAGWVPDSYGYLPWRGPKLLDAGDEVALRNALTATDTVQTRANLLDATNVMEEAALDRYGFVRNAYLQRRQSQVYDGNPPVESFDDYEDYDLDYDLDKPAAAPGGDAGGPAPAAPGRDDSADAPAKAR